MIGTELAKNLKIYTIHIVFVGTAFLWLGMLLPLFSQTVQNRTIYLGKFQPFKTVVDPTLPEKISASLKRALEQKGFKVLEQNNNLSKEEYFSEIQNVPGAVYVSGYYQKNKNENLSLYSQIYNPVTGNIIDAMNLTEEVSKISEISLPEEENRENDQSILEKFSDRLTKLILINPLRKERAENIQKYISSSQISKEIQFSIRKEDKAFSADAIFKFMEDTEVVTATRTKTKIKDAPAAMYVIDSQQIRERGYKTLEDALHDIPGFDYQHTYGLYPNLINQRGLLGNMQRTLLYVDGVPDNNLNENAMLGGSVQFPLANVDRIEIISGPASALYGANAFNGIINIITRDGEKSPGHHAEITYGTWEGTKSNPGRSISFSSRNSTQGENPFQFSVGGYYFKSAGPDMSGIQNLDPPNYGATKTNPNYDYRNDPYYQYSKKACGNTMCSPDSKSVGYYWSPAYNVSDVETYNVTAKLSKGGFRFQTVNWQFLQGDGTFANGTQQIDTKQKGFETGDMSSRNLYRAYGIGSGILTNTSTDSNGKKVTSYGEKGFNGSSWDFRNNSVMVGYLHKFSNQLSLDTEGVVRHTELLNTSHEEYPNQNGPGAIYRPGDTTSERNYSRPDNAYLGEQRLQWNPSQNLSTIFGISAKRFILAKDYGSAELYSYTNYAAYIQQMYKPTDKWALTAGFRRDYITTFGYTSNPRLGSVFTPIKDLTIKFLAGSAFREPSAKELYSQTPQRKPNPDLRPEQLVSYEAGVGYRFLKNYYTSLQGYYNSVTNLILEVQTSDTTPINGKTATGGLPWNQNDNLGKARIYGAEFETNANIVRSLYISFNYTYSKGEYYDLPASLQKSPSTAGRKGDDYGYDAYLEVYKDKTGKSSTVPAKGGIPNIAPHKANLGITWYPIQKLSIYMGVSYVDIRRTIATNPEKTTPGYKMVKMNIRWTDFLFKGFFLQLHVNNVLNEQYFDPGIRVATGGYYPTMHPLERRNVWLSVGSNF